MIGAEHASRHGKQLTVCAAGNYAKALFDLERYAEAKALLCKALPVARRVLGENDQGTLMMRWFYAVSLYRDAGATLDDLPEAVNMLEDIERTARRVLGSAHPTARGIWASLELARTTLRAGETPSPGDA